MDREKAFAKIRKCLALAKSPNPHEAGNALRQAQALMRELGIDETDVELADVQEVSTKGPSSAVVQWQSNLAALVADAFGCEYFGSRHLRIAVGGSSRAHRMYHFVGIGPAAEVASYTFDVLGRQCAKARMAHIAKQPRNCKPITKTARGDLFAVAWVDGVRALVKRFAGSERRTELLEAYMARNYPDLVSVTPKRRDVGRNVRDDDALAGFAAGQRADLKRALDGAEGRKALR